MDRYSRKAVAQILEYAYSWGTEELARQSIGLASRNPAMLAYRQRQWGARLYCQEELPHIVRDSVAILWPLSTVGARYTFPWGPAAPAPSVRQAAIALLQAGRMPLPHSQSPR